MRSQNRERRDWALLIFVVPVGILLMILIGQLAIRILPFWSVNAGMSSKLDPNTESPRPFSLFQPILPQILTPMAWAGTYLTPSGDISFPPFFVFEPGASISPTPVSPTPTGPTPIGTPTTGSLTPIVPTNPPPVNATKPPNVSTTTVPPTVVPTTATTPPTEPSSTEPSPTEPPPTDPPPTDPPPTEIPTGYPSTPPIGYSPISPPPGIIVGPPDGNIGSFGPNQYIVIDLGANPVIVDGNNYDWDMVYYEKTDGSRVFIDNVIVGISMNASGSPYYVVFNWGNVSGIPTDDTNTNLAGIIEEENAEVQASNFYNPPSAGIAINVDGAASQPPPGSYRYVIILAQIGTTSGGDWLEVDSILILP